MIATHTDMKVSVVDHTLITLEDFNYEPGETLVSLDKHVAYSLGIPYYRISRIFDYNGDVIGRYESGCITERGDNVRVLDTDIVNGDTIRYACERFGTTKYSAPLIIQPHQDLIDIEDIMSNNSIIVQNKDLLSELGLYAPNPVDRPKSYMWTRELFHKRTSLPAHMFNIVTKYKDDYIKALSGADFG